MGSNDPTSDRYAEILSRIYSLILSWNDQEQNDPEIVVRTNRTQASLIEDLMPSSDKDGSGVYKSLLTK